MTDKTKAAGRGNGQAAFKPSSTFNHSNRKTSTSTFIQVDAQYAVGADSHSWHVLQRWL
jgi:hypothetical protein